MKIQYIASATVLIECDGVKVLCDPWLIDGAYYGSWYHYPPLTVTPEDFSDVDYLYISHIHPDHLDVATLKRMPKSIPICIHDYSEKFLMRLLASLGFEKIIELENNSILHLSKNFSIEIFAADNCDPAVCGKLFGCSIMKPYNKTMQIDSLAVFQGEGKVVVNSNDCPYELAQSVCDAILKKHKQIDFLLVGYAGAGPYPQCFDNLNQIEKKHKKQVKRQQFLHQALQYLKHLKPHYFMPFAGQYVLGGTLSCLNDNRGIPELEELEDIFCTMLSENDLKSKIILLNRQEEFDVVRSLASAPFIKSNPLDRQAYIETILLRKKYIYQESENLIQRETYVDLTDRLIEAQQRMLRYQEKFGYYSKWVIYLDAGQSFFYRIPFDGSKVSKVNESDMIEPFVKIKLDYTLLHMILNRKAHWNNSEIGSHLKYFRQPDIFERGIYHFLSYLHC